MHPPLSLPEMDLLRAAELNNAIVGGYTKTSAAAVLLSQHPDVSNTSHMST